MSHYEFRTVLGEPVNGGGDGPQAAGRREIRWDGVPPDQSDNEFGDINPDYAAQFESFSMVKTFMASGSTRMTLTFRLPGTETPALTRDRPIVGRVEVWSSRTTLSSASRRPTEPIGGTGLSGPAAISPLELL